MQRKKEEIKNQIIESAKAHFLEKGFQNASMRAIAAEVKISAGNIYTYFQSKEDLFLHILTLNQQKRLKFLFDKIRQGKTGLDKIKIYAEEYFKYIEKQPDVLKFGVYWEFHGLDYSRISKETNQMRENIFADFNLWDFFLDGMQDGSILKKIDKQIYTSFTMIIRLLMNEVLVLKYQDRDFYFKYLEFFLDALKSK